MLVPHYRMRQSLKTAFLDVDKALQAERRAQLSVFRNEYTYSDEELYAGLANKKRHLACVNAMKAINEINWLKQVGELTLQSEDMAERFDPLLSLVDSIKAYYNESGMRAEIARQIILKIDSLNRDIYQYNPHIKINAGISAACEAILILASAATMTYACALLMGVVSIAACGPILTCVLGLSLLLFGAAASTFFADCFASYVNLGLENPMKDLTEFSKALAETHKIEPWELSIDVEEGTTIRETIHKTF